MIPVQTNQMKSNTVAGKVGEFTIATSAKAFKILSSNLYKDKIASIIRELISNAVDSHKVAGTKEPIIVTIPTRHYLNFEVEDFGTGLSETELFEVYTSYFSSNKTQSNELIGFDFEKTVAEATEWLKEYVKKPENVLRLHLPESFNTYMDKHGLEVTKKAEN